MAFSGIESGTAEAPRARFKWYLRSGRPKAAALPGDQMWANRCRSKGKYVDHHQYIAEIVALGYNGLENYKQALRHHKKPCQLLSLKT